MTPPRSALLEENDQWYARAGGGELALLNRATLASVQADRDALHAVRTASRAAGDEVAEVAALDALARLAATGGDGPTAAALLAEADDLVSSGPGQAHGDRLDADLARASSRVTGP